MIRIRTLAALGLAVVVAGCVTQSERAELQRTPYNRPLFSSGAQFGALPPAVQNTVRAEAGSEEISDIIKDNSTGEPIYMIHFDNRAVLPVLYVARDGSVLNPDFSVAVAAPHETASTIGSSFGRTVKLTDLPEKVLEVIHQQDSRAEIATIDKATWGNRTVYIVTFKDESHHPQLYIESDGTLLKEVQQ